MAMPEFNADEEKIIKEVREMIHRDQDNGTILERLSSQYSNLFSEDELKKLIEDRGGKVAGSVEKAR